MADEEERMRQGDRVAPADDDKAAWRRRVSLRAVLAMADATAYRPGDLAGPTRGSVND